MLSPENEKNGTESEDADKRYKAPALEKGLDILELLAKTGEPLTTSQIANKLGRSVSELFRMVLTLEQRGYIAQVGGKEGYGLTNKMFSLGIAQTPTRTLVEAALPIMKDLTYAIGQSCHLVVVSDDQIVVIARIESPLALGFSCRVGFRRVLVDSPSGVVIWSGKTTEERDEFIEGVRDSVTDQQIDFFVTHVEKAREQGYIRMPSDVVRGVTDLSAPIFSSRNVVAALTIPYVQCTPQLCSEEEALIKLQETADKISDSYSAEAQQ